jgi:hypothetical protein
MDSNSIKFAPWEGPTGDLLVDENHLVFKWIDGNIFFSVSRRGNAASCHFACDKNSLRDLKQAIDEFVEFVFWIFDWATMVMAQVRKQSVARTIKKCGFFPIGEAEGITVYVRPKSWVTSSEKSQMSQLLA